MHITEHGGEAKTDSRQADARYAAGSGDEPKPAAISSSLQEDNERFNDVGLKALHRAQNTVPIKGLPWTEAYVEGSLWVAVQYSHPRAFKEMKGRGLLAVFPAERNVLDSGVHWPPIIVEEIKPLDMHVLGGWNEDMVLVGNVEKVETIKPKFPLLVGLYAIDDSVHDSIGGERNSLRFLSLDGAFKRSPVASKGEVSSWSNAPSVRLDHNAISVVESRPEIMDRISQNGWSMLREGSRGSIGSPYQKLIIFLGAHSFGAARYVCPEDCFEVVDVMIGPFYL
jgi:hypothetical protein